MQKITITGGALSPIVTSSATDMLVVVRDGFALLCFGPSAGVPIENCVPAPPGYQIVVPAGVPVYGAAGPGPTAVLIVAPFGS